MSSSTSLPLLNYLSPEQQRKQIVARKSMNSKLLRHEYLSSGKNSDQGSDYSATMSRKSSSHKKALQGDIFTASHSRVPSFSNQKFDHGTPTFMDKNSFKKYNNNIPKSHHKANLEKVRLNVERSYERKAANTIIKVPVIFARKSACGAV